MGACEADGSQSVGAEPRTLFAQRSPNEHDPLDLETGIATGWQQSATLLRPERRREQKRDYFEVQPRVEIRVAAPSGSVTIGKDIPKPSANARPAVPVLVLVDQGSASALAQAAGGLASDRRT